MKRVVFFLYGLACHLLFLAVFAYLAGFIANVLVPKSIDAATGEPVSVAVAINLLLIFMFGAQHSIMARPAFKRLWTRVVPEPIERSTYVLVSCLVTAILMWRWRGIDTIVWDVQQPVLRALLWGLYATGLLLVPFVTFLIDHFDLFGTRQVWLHLQGHDYTPLPFRIPSLYKYVRHPLYIGWAIAFWATPMMTVGHLLFAGAMTAYMALATVFEERDLVAHFGREYEEYQRQVPKVRAAMEGTITMPRLIREPQIVTAAGTKPKRIEEFAGRVSSGHDNVSIARMISPSGWQEPAQQPEFEEITVVLRGTLRVETDDGALDVQAGQAVVVRAGERVRYSTPGSDGAEYIAVCLPAFSPQTVHRCEN